MSRTTRVASAAVTMTIATSSVLCSGGTARAVELHAPDAGTPIAATSAAFVPSPGEKDSEQRAVPILAIIGAVIAIGGSYSAMGREAGERVYHAGVRNAAYQQVKWKVRAAAVAACGAVGGAIFMTSFDNQFYSMS